MSQPKEFMFYGYDGETVAECCDDEVKVEWAYIGEGYNGDYDPSDPDDVELLRFYVYHIDDGEWVEVEDASYCTNMPLRADQSIIEASLLALFDRFSDALGDWPYCSVKKLGEEVRGLYSQIMAHDSMRKYQAARAEFEQLLDGINRVIAYSAAGQDPDSFDPTAAASCSGDCSACGGCH